MLVQFINNIKLILIAFTLILLQACNDDEECEAKAESSRTIELFIINGELAPVEAWPATYLMLNGANGPCTATRVGERVMISAAHCVREGVDTYVGLKVATTQPLTFADSFLVNCAQHPNFKNDHRYDYTLCEIPEDGLRKIGSSQGVNENILIDHTSIKKGDDLMVLGFGCEDENNHSNYELMIGKSTIEELPAVSNPTILSKGPSFLCDGDSGGAAYQKLSSSACKSQRAIVGVNRGSDLPFPTENTLVATSDPSFIRWAFEWIEEGSRQSIPVDRSICGISPSAKGCRIDDQ